jgi:hypothetical protein
MIPVSALAMVTAMLYALAITSGSERRRSGFFQSSRLMRFRFAYSQTLRSLC